MKKTALFCISSLGLGHATRTLSVVNSYLDTHEVHIMSAGKALAYMKDALMGTDTQFYEFKDYPPLERGKGLLFYLYLFIDSLNTVRIIRNEEKYISNLCQKIKPEFILSDGRYGSHVETIPSFLISHQISFIMPKGFGIFGTLADYFNYRTFKKFNKIFIPDYREFDGSLAGKLSHHSMLDKLPHEYVGILSSIKNNATVKDIDFLFVISGYLEEHKHAFITSLIEESKKLNGKKVFVLGDPSKNTHDTIPSDNLEIFSSVSGKERNILYNRSKCVISRSGYTTVMDLVELGISGYLVPTPGQTEQEYLAAFLGDKKYFITSTHGIDVNAIQNMALGTLFNPSWKTNKSIEKIKETISRVIEHKPQPK